MAFEDNGTDKSSSMYNNPNVLVLFRKHAETQAHGRSHSALPSAQQPNLCRTQQVFEERRQRSQRCKRGRLECGARSLLSAAAASDDDAVALSRSEQIASNAELENAPPRMNIQLLI